jgi:nitronate monooxygenase
VLLDQCPVPVVLAPLAGGPSTPELCAAVSESGGLGFLAAGYLPAAELDARVDRTRGLTRRPFAVNLFCPGAGGDAAAVDAYAERLGPQAAAAGVVLGRPGTDDDDWDEKLELLATRPVPLVSFTFGCPDPDVVGRLRDAGSEVWVTVTGPREARLAEHAGADGLVAQGLEAGGHRGGFRDEDDGEGVGLLALLQLLRTTTALPLVATGGIMTGAGLAAALVCGARAGALGTAFLRCPEAGTSAVHRQALEDGAEPTALTRAFTGRLARGIRNRFLVDNSAAAPSAYPQVHHLTAPLRAHGRSVGDRDMVNLWAGQAYPLADGIPAREVVARVHGEARAALARAQQRL